MSTQENGGPESPSASNSKDAIFEPKPKPKMIRVLTVLAYVLSVSMAAILLSIYYIFMWDGKPHLGALRSHDVEAVDSDAHNHTDRNMASTSDPDYLYNRTILVDVTRIRNLTRNNYEDAFNKTMKEEDITEQYGEAISDVEEVPVSSTVPTTTEEVLRTLPDDYDEFPIASSGTFIRKMFGRYEYEDS